MNMTFQIYQTSRPFFVWYSMF